MNFLKSNNSIKRKVSDVKDDIEAVIKNFIDEKFWVESYGVYELDPKYLVIWICLEKDTTKAILMSDKKLLTTLRDILEKHNYPKEAIPFVDIGFESQETVDRESNGDWYMHFK